MKMRIVRSALLPAVFLAMAFLLIPNAYSQTTLGGITGTVTDSSGAVISGATVTLVGDETKLNRTQTTSSTGSYSFVNLPIGTYTLSFTQQGFESQNIPSIAVQANRTATVNAELKIGNVSESITVEETPLINMVDTTNGYVMDKLEIEAVPLPDWLVHRAGDSFARRECGTLLRDRRQCGPGQRADVGERTARHQQHLHDERRQCLQPVQRQEHQRGQFRPRRE